MKMNDLGLPDVSALVAFGKLGMQVVASRMLTLLALTGIVAISTYSVYAASWIGAACVGIMALLVFVPALKAETRREKEQDAAS